MTVSLVLPLRSGPASAASDGLRSGSIGGMVKLPRHAEVMFSRQVWGLDCERPLLLETLATWIRSYIVGPVYEGSSLSGGGSGVTNLIDIPFQIITTRSVALRVDARPRAPVALQQQPSAC